MRRQATASTDRSGVHVVGRMVEEELQCIFREQPIEDYGIDAQMELVTTDAVVTGRLVGLQIKSGPSYFKEVERSKTESGWNFYANSAHLTYWLQHSLPVVIVINAPATNDAYYQVVDQTLIHETAKGFNLYIPEENRFDASARDTIANFVAAWRDLESSLGDALGLLPPNSAGTLRRASEVDPPAAARLANALAAGRSSPELTGAALVAAQPSWILISLAEQDLWIAVGNYCTAHDCEGVAADAFWLASECEGERAARAMAAAGLCLLNVDRGAAQPLLEEARRQGQVLVADVGLAALYAPPNYAPVLPIPQSLTDATDEELDAEPTALNFLAEMALRSGNSAKAIAYRERAIGSAEVPDPQMSLALAQTLWRHAREDGGHFTTLKRRALTLTQKATEERRRWDGPSADALVVHLDIQLTAGFNDDAVRCALPTTQGGTAQSREASNPAVARRGAIAALACDNADALAFFLAQLIGTPAEREIQALQADEPAQRSEMDDSAAVQRWRAVLAESRDDQMKARATSRLVDLGVWPPEVDDLIERSIIPESQTAILRASFKVQSTGRSREQLLGFAQLRDLARNNAMAALKLVMLLASHKGVDEAIAECEHQLHRWSDPTLIQLLIDLQRQGGHSERAVQIALDHIDDESMPVEVRQQLCKTYVSLLFKQKRFADAIGVAEKGIALGQDSDLAWNLVTLLAQVGNLARARNELARYELDPVSDQETRLWLDLHLGVSLPAKDARTMLELAEQHASTALGQNILRLLAREVLGNTDGEQYPTSLIEDVEAIIESSLALRDAPRDLSDSEVRTFFDAGPLTQSKFREMVGSLRSGRVSHHGAAHALNQPYGSALLQHVSGVQVAFDLQPKVRIVGKQSAAGALLARGCVVDLSALRTLSILPSDAASLIRDRLGCLKTSADTARDATRTRELMRGVGAAPFVVSVSDSGEAARHVLPVSERLALADAAARLERETSSTTTQAVPGESLVAQIQTLALNDGHPVWCDESILRQALRTQSVQCFSTLDLLDVLREQSMPVDTTACMIQLGLHRLADLPLSGEAVVRIAQDEQWAVGSANVAMARASWWQPEGRKAATAADRADARGDWALTWQEDWLEVALAAAKHSYAAVLLLTGAALIGICQSVPASLSTQVFQQLVVCTLHASHLAGRSEAARLLQDLSAGEMNPADAPNPIYVMRALAEELNAAGVSDADAVAWNLTGQPQF